MAKMTTGGPPGVRLDAAIERALSTPSLDGVTRVQLTEMQGALHDARGAAEAGATGARGLRDALFTFVMPRLQHPDVLQAERHRVLLERLADGLAARDADPAGPDNVVREGVLTLRRELRRLAVLRQQRNSLVEG